MRHMKVKRVIGVIVLLAVAGIALAAMPVAQAGNNNGPELPSPSCDSIRVPAGHELAYHVYARGVQKYRWNGTAWVRVDGGAAVPRQAGPRRGRDRLHGRQPARRAGDDVPRHAPAAAPSRRPLTRGAFPAPREHQGTRQGLRHRSPRD